MFSIGPYSFANPVVLAPMAGITDLPFRRTCVALGAGLSVSEMVTADTHHWQSTKSRTRLTFEAEGPAVTSVQIVGACPQQLALAAQQAEALGAPIIDINMGCPAKKVCNKAAGSALLRDETLVAAIVEAVVKAVKVPVTLKIRTGWCPATKNAVRVGQIAESSGIQALTLHGRTRACKFNGQAEHHTLAELVQAVNIPVIANGDITHPRMAQALMQNTGAAAVMIGRAALGNPWLLGQIHHYLQHHTQAPGPAPIGPVVQQHLEGIYGLYGDFLGLRIARKHMGWYIAAHCPSHLAPALRSQFNAFTTLTEQLQFAQTLFEHPHPLEDQAA